MQPIAEAVTDPSLVFNFPSPPALKPPLVQLDHAAVGYDGKAILEQIDLRLDPDDRLALLGRNGNGKTTLARLLSGQLAAMAGSKHAPGKLRVGYFTQYQVEELDSTDTPLEHMSRLMKGANPSQVRAQLGRFGFSGPMAEQKVGKMSGGEKARLALALITRDAPHLLILDEPTNHLDVDTREALVQALNDYNGAVVVVSHDRHMIEASADRLVLVDAGRAREFAGSLDDYTDTILGRGQGSDGKPKPNKKNDRKAAAEAREAGAAMRKVARAAEAEVAKLTARRTEIDRILLNPTDCKVADMGRKPADLMQERGRVEVALEKAENAWLEANEALESAS
jgi:ATP-binding cassette subfamily F protein 3